MWLPKKGSSVRNVMCKFLFFRKSENVDEWTEYYEKYSEWYSQYSKQYENPLEANSGPKEEVKQLSFEELLQQLLEGQLFHLLLGS